MSGPWEDYAQPSAPAPAGPWADYAPKRSLVQDVTGFMANVNRGLGIGDELAAGAKTLGHVVTGQAGLDPSKGAASELQAIGNDFNRSMASQRQIEDSFTAAHPHISALAKGTGNALTMAAPVGPGAAAFAEPVAIAGREIPALAVNALRGATVGGLSGAGYAAVDRGSLGQRAGAAAQAAQDPVTLGLGAVAGSLATPRAARVERPPAPSLEDLTAQKNAAYKAVDDSGVTYTPQAFSGLTQDMAQALDENGFHAGLHPKTAAMMQRIGESDRAAGGYAPTLTQLDQLRQQVGRDIASSPDPGERRMGQIMRGKIDDFIAGAGPDQISAGDPQAAAAMIGNARDLNTRVMKLEKLDGLDEAAADRANVTGSGGNINNTTRQNVLRFKNQSNNLTPDEEAAAQRVISGTPLGNVLRQVGKTAPGNGGLMANGHLMAAGLSHGASVPIGIGASIAKMLGDAATSRNVQALRELIANGGQAASEVSRQLADPQYAEIRAQLANDLAAQAGIQGSGRRGSVTVELPGRPDLGVGASSR